MHFILFVSFLSADAIINKKIYHLTFFKKYIYYIHDSIAKNFIGDIEQRRIDLEKHLNKHNIKFKETTDKNLLFERLYELTFCENFIKRKSYIIGLYGNIFSCLKSELFKKFNEIQNIEKSTNPEYITLFCDTFVTYLKNTIKMSKDEDYKYWEIDLLAKHFSKQKINLKSKQDTTTIDFKDLNQVIMLKTLLRENMIGKIIDLTKFFDINKFINQIDIYSAENKINNEQKIFIIDFNSDFIFLIRFYKETKTHDLQSLSAILLIIKKKIQENISLVKNQNLKAKINEIKIKNNVIFHVSQVRSDFINIYFEFIKDQDDDAKNYKLNELTNMIFDIQKDLKIFLYELFNKSESIGQDMEFEVGG